MSHSATEALYLVVARVRGMIRAERGQTLSEYGLIVTAIAIGVTAVGLIAFRTVLVDGFDAMANCLLDLC